MFSFQSPTGSSAIAAAPLLVNPISPVVLEMMKYSLASTSE